MFNVAVVILILSRCHSHKWICFGNYICPTLPADGGICSGLSGSGCVHNDASSDGKAQEQQVSCQYMKYTTTSGRHFATCICLSHQNHRTTYPFHMQLCYPLIASDALPKYPMLEL